MNFECQQFSEAWSIAAVLASNLIYAFTMNLPLFQDSPNLLNVVNATASIEATQTSTGTVYETTRLRDGLYQDPFTWTEGHFVFMAFFQLALELPVDILSTRALELLRQPVFAALRPHLRNARVMYAFQIFISLAMISLIVNFKHEQVFGALLHHVNCTDPNVQMDCRGEGLPGSSLPSKWYRAGGWTDPLDICCMHTMDNQKLHPCNQTDEDVRCRCDLDLRPHVSLT